MRILKFDPLLLLVQIWNDLTRWLVVCILGLLSSVDDLAFFLFSTPHMDVFLHRHPACPHRLDSNANISRILTAALKSDWVNKKPWVDSSCAFLCPEGLMSSADKQKKRGGHCPGVLLISTSPSSHQRQQRCPCFNNNISNMFCMSSPLRNS